MNRLFLRNKLTDSIMFRPITGYILAAIVLTAISFFLQQSPMVRDIEQRFQTHFHLYRRFFSTPEVGPTPVVTILINDQSLPEGTSRSPIDRRWIASVIDRISAHQPTLIGLNILLDRPLNPLGDQVLANALARSGRVIIRSDPLYPALPRFRQSALDYGTLRFRNDSSGTVQEICHSAATCRSDRFFHTRLQHHLETDSNNTTSTLQQDWLRIDFSGQSAPENSGQYTRIPVFTADELNQVPAGALKDKIVLIGTGFSDLYPLYRTPLFDDEQFHQETEILAQVLDMLIFNRTLNNLPEPYTTIGILVLLMTLSLVILRQGALTGLWVTAILIPVLFLISAVLFTAYRVAVPFILPATLLLLFLVGSTIQQILQERFTRLMAEISLKEAKIDFLTNELHTHHLFNELSRLSVMISRQPEQARAYLVEFAELLRASLKYGDQPRVPIPIQMEYIQTYLQQQGLVHGDPFKFSVDVAGEISSLYAPWHVFYPLVENAVKASELVLKREPGQMVTVRVTLEREEARIVFRVENPFLPDEKSRSTQKGLVNLEERLKWAYPKGGYRLSSHRQNDTWVATLELPLNSL